MTKPQGQSYGFSLQKAYVQTLLSEKIIYNQLTWIMKMKI